MTIRCNRGIIPPPYTIATGRSTDQQIVDGTIKQSRRRNVAARTGRADGRWEEHS